MSALLAAVDFERAENTNVIRVNYRLTPRRQQHDRGQLAARQAALQDARYDVCVAAQRLAAMLPATRHGIEVLIPEQREFAERVEPAPYQAVNQREIGLGAAVADLAVFVEIEDADIGHLGRMQVFVKVAG